MRAAFVTSAVVFALVAPPVARAQSTEIKDAAAIPPFSAGKVGAPQAPWEIVRVNDKKKLTDFDMVDDGGKVVLHARSDQGEDDGRRDKRSTHDGPHGGARSKRPRAAASMPRPARVVALRGTSASRPL